jgi:hypothetical protein
MVVEVGLDIQTALLLRRKDNYPARAVVVVVVLLQYQKDPEARALVD